MGAKVGTSKPLVERRRYMRLNSHAPVQFRNVLKPQEQFDGTLSKDLSAGGLCMTTESFISPESRLVLLVSLPGTLKSIRLICQVAWTQQQRFADGYECGVEFIEINPEDRQEIDAFVQRAREVSSATYTQSKRLSA